MSENFEALIKAKLDASDFPDQIKKQIEQNKACEISLKINTEKIVSDIENALKGVNFNIDTTITPTISSTSAKATAQKAAAEMSTAINTGINLKSINEKLSKALDVNGIDSKLKSDILKSFEKDVNGATISLKTMSAQFKKTGDDAEQLKKISFTGIDKDGKTLSVLSEIDKKSGEVKSTVTTVTQKFGETEKAVEQVNKDFERMLQLRKQIDSLKISEVYLDASKNGNELKAVKAIISDLETEYAKLKETAGSSLTSAQTDKLEASIASTVERVKQLQQILSGKTTDQKVADSLKKLKQSQEEVDSIKLKVDTKEFDLEISRIKTQYSKLQIAGTVSPETTQSVSELGNLYERIKASINIINDPTKIVQHSSAVSALTSDYAAYEKLLPKIRNELGLASDAGKNVVSNLDILTQQNKMSQWLEKNSKASKDFGTQIEALLVRLKALDPESEDAAKALAEIKEEFDKIQQSAIAAGKTGKSFGDKLKKALGGLAGLFTFENLFDKAIELLKDMYQQVYDIDVAMIDLQKVTDETDARYERFLKNSAESAKELGSTISSIVEQTANWAKLGYNIDDSEELAKLSTIYSNVAEVDDDTAVSDMVTAMKAFNIEANNAVSIVDSLNELGNNFATDAASLGEGLSKSASAMSAAGTDMYKTLAMLTGGAEITQNAGEFGNFLKIASMRIRAMTGELEDLGEEVDESVDSISKVQTQILNLTHGKVNIFDDMGEFRDYYEIMEDIADVMDELTSSEQASLTEILFGKQRGNQGQALIQAFQSGQIQKAYESAMNSAGSAAAEQEKWMEGLEAKVQQFQAAWQELSATILSSDFLKGLVDTGTSLLEVLTKIIDTIGLFPTILAGAGITAFVQNLD